MRIAVCFKTVPDYSRLSAGDWSWDSAYVLDTRVVRLVFNCFEESALEIALNLRGTSEVGPETTRLTALTVDSPRGDLFLKHLGAVGYDRLVRIACGEGIDLRFNPAAVSELLGAYFRSEEHHFVFLGQQGAEGDNGQTGFLLAEQLGWPCFREVSAVTGADSPCRLNITHRIHGATRVQTVAPPAVLIAGQCPDTPYLRVPTLKEKLDARKKVIQCLSIRQLGCDAPTLADTTKTLIRLQRPQAKRPCVFIEGPTPREQARQLYDRYLEKVLSS